MAGNIQPVFSKREFEFPATTTGAVVLARWIDVTPYKEVTLVARLHLDSSGTGSSISVVAKAISPSDEDPGTDFLFGTALATVTFSNGGTDTMKYASLGTAFGSHVQIQVTAVKGAGACKFTLSVELVGKE